MSHHFFLMSYKDTEIWKLITDSFKREPDLEFLQGLADFCWPQKDIKFENFEEALMWAKQNWEEIRQRLKEMADVAKEVIAENRKMRMQFQINKQ